MIDKQLLTQTVNDALKEMAPVFLVDITVSRDNDIVVTIDSPDGIDIEQCLAINHRVEEVFDREVEDYSLEVGSAGLTAPFKVRQQYEMNIGQPVEVLTRDGHKLHGTLVAVSDDFKTCTVTVPTKVKNEGEKRPHVEDIENVIPIENIKSIACEIKF